MGYWHSDGVYDPHYSPPGDPMDDTWDQDPEPVYPLRKIVGITPSLFADGWTLTLLACGHEIKHRGRFLPSRKRCPTCPPRVDD